MLGLPGWRATSTPCLRIDGQPGSEDDGFPPASRISTIVWQYPHPATTRLLLTSVLEESGAVSGLPVQAISCH